MTTSKLSFVTVAAVSKEDEFGAVHVLVKVAGVLGDMRMTRAYNGSYQVLYTDMSPSLAFVLYSSERTAIRACIETEVTNRVFARRISQVAA